MAGKCDDVARLKRLEQLLDRKFSIAGIEFGLDGVLGLVPVVGDVASSLLGMYIISEARRLGAKRITIIRMVGAWAVDSAVGAIPIVGDLFDIAYKSNTKNVKLLIADLERRATELREVNRGMMRAA